MAVWQLACLYILKICSWCNGKLNFPHLDFLEEGIAQSACG